MATENPPFIDDFPSYKSALSGISEPCHVGLRSPGIWAGGGPQVFALHWNRGAGECLA